MLDSSKLKELADNNFKSVEIDRKFSKRVENTVGKGEIARYEQFLLFPPCFQRVCSAGRFKPGLVWERVKHIYFTSVKKQVHTCYTNLSRSWVLGTTPVYSGQMCVQWANAMYQS